MLSEENIREFVETRGYSPSTRVKYRGLLRRYASEVTSDPDAWEQASVEWLEGLKVEPNTRRYYYNVLHGFLNWCLSKGYVPSNPMRLMRIRASGTALRYALTVDEVQRLVTVTRRRNNERALRDCAIILLMLHTGLRVGGVAGLDVQDFVQVKASRVILKYKGKGHEGKDSIVVVPQVALQAIDDYLRPRGTRLFGGGEGPLFLTVWRDKCKLSEARMREAVSERLSEAGIKRKGVCVHSLRHTAATMAYEAGADVMAIKDMLDHRSLETTQGYLHSIDRIEGAAELKIDYGLDPGGRAKKRRR